MAQTLINVRMDTKVKKDMEKTCKDLGLTMSAAFNIFARKMIREKAIPFDVSIDPFYSKENLKALNKSKKQIDSGKKITKTLKELEAMEN